MLPLQNISVCQHSNFVLAISAPSLRGNDSGSMGNDLGGRSCVTFSNAKPIFLRCGKYYGQARGAGKNRNLPGNRLQHFVGRDMNIVENWAGFGGVYSLCPILGRFGFCWFLCDPTIMRDGVD